MTQEPTQTEFDLELRLLLEAIYLRYQHDFRRYAMASLRRRVGQAMERLRIPSLAALQERVLRDPELFQQLLPFLTVQVSEMFRDPAFFRAMREDVVPHLRTYPSLRVWIAGCSTGEEVHAVAILLAEEGLLDRTLIYASDISPQALRAAEEGIYALERIAEFSASYVAAGGRGSLSDYYTAAYGAAVFDRALRRNVVFADHSLATDQVFAEVQLVTCRNVLIYFDHELQDRAVGLFRDALCHRGFLGLGSKETLRFSRHADAFTPFVPEVRIFRKR
ncbi:CheR family methyltransferase [Anaeromyxobacter oryzae]|uniref:Chemotaxis protein CheR n=1 Tax=Anaeromyxobacter oryzae TaxID=2918170 RepID=A0ABM7X142_9BACT|nr:CheR family methyltransferase [Anaeromyxobacter oryzae]BDG05486.1 chemotaxis protein CheR [Anaeromyxobacter oryzae]